jgi:hypothetical protein
VDFFLGSYHNKRNFEYLKRPKIKIKIPGLHVEKGFLQKIPDMTEGESISYVELLDSNKKVIGSG